ncbi:MAG: glycosyltransferase family 2 protein [Firmicutes bacterium]|nr:glycosyltransferase family 2 protein [Bacillota bacterium]
MLLTIGMIMKNEERFLRDCLTAIKPILDNVDSELIICDTGSTDNSIAIAKEFTDNVFEIEWCNDFAWARQQGFERAKGEWFLVLDPDEIFEDVQEIIDFFNSSDYKKYGAAIVNRDNNPESSENKIIGRVLRLFKIIDGMQWNDKVHEHLSPYEEPVKQLDCLMLHYGLMQGEISEKKSQLYFNLVQNIYKEDPTNYTNIFSLATNYINQPQITIEYLEMGFNLAKQTELHEEYLRSPLMYASFAQLLTAMYVENQQYTKAIDFVANYFENTPKSKLLDNAFLLKYMQITAYINEHKFLEANKSALLAYKLKDQMDNHKLSPAYSFVQLPIISDEEFISKILETFVLSNLLQNAIEYLQNLSMTRKLPKRTITINQYECYKSLTTAIINHNPQMLANLHSHFAEKYQPTDKQYIDIITTIELEISAQENSAKINLAKNILATATSQNSPYIKLQQLRLFLDESQATSYNIDELLNYFLQQESLPLIYIDVLAVAKKYNKNFAEIAQKINLAESIEILGNIVQPVNLIMNMANIFM